MVFQGVKRQFGGEIEVAHSSKELGVEHVRWVCHVSFTYRS